MSWWNRRIWIRIRTKISLIRNTDYNYKKTKNNTLNDFGEMNLRGWCLGGEAYHDVSAVDGPGHLHLPVVLGLTHQLFST